MQRSINERFGWRVLATVSALVLTAACSGSGRGGGSGGAVATGGRGGIGGSDGTGGSNTGGSGASAGTGGAVGSGGAGGTGGATTGGQSGTGASGGRGGGAGGAAAVHIGGCPAPIVCPSVAPAAGASCSGVSGCCLYQGPSGLSGAHCDVDRWRYEPSCSCPGGGTGGSAGAGGSAGTGGSAGAGGRSGAGGTSGAGGGAVFGSCSRNDPASCPAGYQCACGGPGPAGVCRCHRTCATAAECGGGDLRCGCTPPVSPATSYCVDACFCECD